jgi:hypothetical protein
MAIMRMATLVLAGMIASAASADQPGLFDGMADSVLGNLGYKKSAQEVHEASDVAAHFMAQFYGVSPDSISTMELEGDGHVATVSAANETGEACNFEVVKASQGVEARYGWLISSIECN